MRYLLDARAEVNLYLRTKLVATTPKDEIWEMDAKIQILKFIPVRAVEEG
jgi:hypothetical protein